MSESDRMESAAYQIGAQAREIDAMRTEITRLTALVSRLRARCEEVERDGHPCGSRQAAADLICILDEGTP